MAGYQGRGSKVGNKIVAQSVKEQGGRAAAAKNAVKGAAKAAVFAYNPNKFGKIASAVSKARSVRGSTAIAVRKSASGTVTKTGTKASKGKTESFSYSEKGLTKAERAEIRKQNKAAETMKSRSLEKVESGKKGAATRKLRQEEREEYAYKLGNKSGRRTGRAEGAVATAVVGAAGISLYEKNKKDSKKKSSKKK